MKYAHNYDDVDIAIDDDFDNVNDTGVNDEEDENMINDKRDKMMMTMMIIIPLIWMMIRWVFKWCDKYLLYTHLYLMSVMILYILKLFSSQAYHTQAYCPPIVNKIQNQDDKQR